MQAPETSSTSAAFAALDALEPSQAQPAGLDQPSPISGRSAPVNITPARVDARSLDPASRLAIVTAALPELERGATLRELAAKLAAGELGALPAAVVDHVTLRGWCIAYDAPAYRDALRAQVGARLSATVEELEECQRIAELGTKATEAREMVQTGEGKQDSFQLIGPELVKAARARASIAESAGKFWALMAERRLPAAFGKVDAKPPTGPARASFVFIVDGRKREHGGRILEQPGTAAHPAGALPPALEELEA